MALEKVPYRGNGKCLLAEIDGTTGAIGALRDIGNTLSFNLSIETDTVEVVNMRGEGGNYYAEYPIKAVKFDLEVTDHSAKNKAMGTKGDLSNIASATVTDEVQKAFLDAPLVFDFIPDLTVDPVVKDNAGTTTYVKNTDYTVTEYGIIPLESGSIVDESNIKVSYTKIAQTKLEALVAGDIEYRVILFLKNKALNDKRIKFTGYKGKFSPMSGQAYITTDIGTLKFEGQLIADENITGTGLSKFYSELVQD
ncbi:MAG: hypothetical protein V9H25_06635 [Candidatus Competibacter sp.]|jgi:hypothetical protein